MLATTRHGQKIPTAPGQQPSDCGVFAYLFPGAPAFPKTETTLEDFESLHAKMLDQPRPGQLDNSGLPPVMTYFGQFIDHDLMAKSDPDDLIDIFQSDLKPASRAQVQEGLFNARSGRLNLDSLYGPARPLKDAALDKLRDVLRYPGDRAMMWVAQFDTEAGTPGVRFPEDRAGDVLRLGQALSPFGDDREPLLSAADVDALPAEHRAMFVDAQTGALNLHRAILADPRNDENLFIAQLHVALLRFHNRMVQAWPKARQVGDDDEVYEWAREQVTLHYQWLILNAYLPAICDRTTYREIMDQHCALYAGFLRQTSQPAGAAFPIPMEFSFAAFRFGHSMVRGGYDWNQTFGRGAASRAPQASFAQMFEFTGASPNPMGGAFDRLPDFWGADWDRLVHPVSAHASRAARPIDTRIAVPLTEMAEDIVGADCAGDAQKSNLIARNLRSGFGHNLPSAQACLDGIEARFGTPVKRLTRGQIASGPTGSVVRRAGFELQTPLWFYVLKEAEVLSGGEHLGPLGTHLVAGTIAGVILHDPTSCWNRKGSVEGRWHPVDGARASGQVVDSFPALMRAAGLL